VSAAVPVSARIPPGGRRDAAMHVKYMLGMRYGRERKGRALLGTNDGRSIVRLLCYFPGDKDK